MDFAVPVDHRIKVKESEKKNKYLDLARELKKLWNIKLIIIPIMIGAFGTVAKGLVNIGPYQLLRLQARVDLGAVAMKEYSAFPKAPALLELHHQIV